VKLTRERKVFLALLGLGVTALAVDRLALGPSDAGAAPAAPAGPSADAAPQAEPAAPAATPENAAPGHAFSERIASRSGSVGTRDPFRPHQSWPTPVLPDEPVAQTVPDEFAAFVKIHKLTATMGHKESDSAEGAFDPATALATINGRYYKVGAVIDDMELTLVDRKGILIKAPSGAEHRVDLPVPDNSPKPQQPPQGR
jgi:hypothetical protein